MAEIEVDSGAYAAARSALTEAADQLSSAQNKISSAVPGMAFGQIGAFIPPVLNAVGGAVEGASSSVATISQRTADGVQKAVDRFETIEENARADLERISVDG
ncbi:hypothetical protein AB0O87_13025 [Microbacterium sp. NPDC076768]|uniref:hypothetical protein n=1 Tax=Microbacterium sp. NPDC076768 TaxID=3154858 RepID=UPI003446DD53